MCTQLGEDDVQAPALDELHGVVVHAVLFAHREDRHDIGMVQPGRGARLEQEAPELDRTGRPLMGQDLERDVPAQRDLLGFEHHAHSASSYLADDPEVAQPDRSRQRGTVR